MNEIEKLAIQECNKNCGRMERIIYGKHPKKIIDKASDLQNAYMLLAKALQEKQQREENKALTNFDRIKNMSAEQMAAFLMNFDECDYCKINNGGCCTNSDCDLHGKKYLIKWLNQPVESEVQDAK